MAYRLFFFIFTLFIFTSFVQAMSQKATNLQKSVHGTWILKSLTCAGKKQNLPMIYKMTFNGNVGEYISQTDKCEQRELETYQYLSADTISIQQGKRICKPNPCDADLPATECGKETNPNLPIFKIQFEKNKSKMILSTSDANSIDCMGAGQAKPAVFEFERK